ncbi:MAG: bifunctional oligoribonuclease/PAP phosphatase NrnA [Thiohalorhabdaceae bacterium]
MANRQRPETVVTSHPNADLDALGSMVAARHIYPGAVAVLAQGAEPQALTLLRWLGDAAPSVLDASQVALEAVTTLIIVDTSTPQRLGAFAELTADPSVRLVVHDHHGEHPDELPPHAEVRATRGGANTSGMVAELQSRGATVGPEEATVMAAGLYEDTGMLTYAGVTGADFEAARWLLEQGADLGLVGRLLRQELSPEQV